MADFEKYAGAAICRFEQNPQKLVPQKIISARINSALINCFRVSLVLSTC